MVNTHKYQTYIAVGEESQVMHWMYMWKHAFLYMVQIP
jgi:hypothetical protein